jgi:uncharacterized protein (DUF1330 family)
MPGYIVAQLRVTDEKVFWNDYVPATPPLIKEYGGRFVVRSDKVELLEGLACAPRLTVIEFPSVEIARDYYNSPEYQKFQPIRRRSCESLLVLTDGFRAPT